MKKLLLVTTLGLALTACSGGGSSSSTNKSNSKPSSTRSESASPDLQNSLVGVRRDLKEQVKALKQINVEGVTIDLASENIGFVEKDLGNGMKGKAYNQTYSAIGYVLPKNVKTDRYGRVIDERASADDISDFGLSTKFENLPTIGVYYYSGVSFGANSEGKLSLNADFANKKVSGEITNRRLLSTGNALFDIDLLETSIRQISSGEEEVHFVGMAKSKVDGYDVHSAYGGKFMGPNAEEVLGYIVDDNADPYEAFAGKK
ncbi:colicin import membrane protein [Actinobacillus ureae]|uniref:factor H binding protein domain-containing protein n=1 Tax=Actinobacillus ureae TaxID=723 RepID=UPI000E1A6BE2|nr:factor H binding protein domain-containing protein [Actinobacillus ureae]SUT86604.1 colicin import membrane protein [Actinobacillus ureae]SUU46426.1 colicin import membrane protein [Actinobacillus ureae]